jgi:MFS family permease
MLVALRAIQAIGGGAFVPSATGIVADQFGPGRDRAIGLFTSIFPIGGIVGPVLGGIFVTYWSWRGIFLVNVPLGLAVFVLVIALVPNSARTGGRRIDAVGIGLLAFGLLGIMASVSYLGSSGSSATSVLFIAPLVVGLSAITGFVRHAGRSSHPFIPLRLLRGRGFAVMNLINFFFGIGALGFATLVPLYAQDRYGLRALQAGTLLTARAIGMICVTAMAVFALRRTGYRPPMIVGFVLAGVGLALMALSPPGLSPYVWLALSAAVTGIGMGISLPAANNAVLQLEPQSTAAVAGLRGMFRQAGGITGISVITTILARSSDPGLAQAHVFVIMGIVLVLLTPLVFLVPEHHGSW